MVELVAENLGLKAEELAELATDKSPDVDDDVLVERSMRVDRLCIRRQVQLVS